MADAKSKCSLRFLLGRHLEKAGGFDSINTSCEVAKKLLLDNIIKEIDDVEWLRETLQNIEKEANRYSRYFQFHRIARAIAIALKENSYSQIFEKDGSIKSRAIVQKSLKQVVSEMKDTLIIHKLAK